MLDTKNGYLLCIAMDLHLQYIKLKTGCKITFLLYSNEGLRALLFLFGGELDFFFKKIQN